MVAKYAKQRKWFATDWLNGDSDWEEGLARWQSVDPKILRFAVYQVESGEGGKPHIQGMLHFRDNLRIGQVKKILGSNTVHLDPVKSDEVAAHYCSKPHEGCSCKHCRKPGTRIWGPAEIGKMPNYKKGSKTNPTDEVISMIQAGMTDEEIAATAAWAILRHSKGIAALRFALMRQQSREWRDVEVILLTGNAGTGKTAYAIADSQDGYFKPDLSKKEIWFDGYQGERTLILDDFRGTSCKFEQLLKLLDGHQLSLPIKGGHTYALWTRVIITSNTTPEEWYHRLSGVSPYHDKKEIDRERLAFWRRVNLNVSDIETPQNTYKDCIEYVGLCIDRERKPAEKPAGNGEQSEDDDDAS